MMPRSVFASSDSATSSFTFRCFFGSNGRATSSSSALKVGQSLGSTAFAANASRSESLTRFRTCSLVVRAVKSGFGGDLFLLGAAFNAQRRRATTGR